MGNAFIDVAGHGLEKAYDNMLGKLRRGEK